MSQDNKKICEVFESGKYCKFGKQCNNLHIRKAKVAFESSMDRHNETQRRPMAQSSDRTPPIENTALPAGARHECGNYRNPETFARTKSTAANRTCKFYANGFCAKGDGCSFLHSDASRIGPKYVPDRNRYSGERDETCREAGDNRVPICRYFMRGFCRYQDSCRWSHDLPVVIAEDRASMTSAEISNPRSHPDRPVGWGIVKDTAQYVKARQKLQLEFPLEDLCSEDVQVLRDKEMVYFKKRFPKAEELSDGVYNFVFRPSDPDWPYDVRCLNMCITFPADYPTKPVSVNLGSNEKLPDTVQRYIWKTMEEWLEKRFLEFVKKGEAELVMRSYLRWLDRNMEDLFTEGLKAYQRQLRAKAAGIEFVPAAQLREEFESRHVEYDENCIESIGEYNNEDSSASENSEDEDTDELLTANPNHEAYSLKAAKKGTEVKLSSFQLKEQACSLVAERINIIVHCGRCRNTTEFDTPPGRINVFRCTKCGQEQLATFRANLAHQFASVIGYLDMKDCGAHDIILSECSFKVGCLECSREVNFGGIIPGQLKESWCRSCHAKLVVTADAVKFFSLQPTEPDSADAVELNVVKVKKLPKDPAIREGFPLPEEGTCKHYKKSFRWFRFPCCGKAYPCDICHDSKESHENVFANRMICGFCCKEQPYAADRPCKACSSSLTKASTSHWEGGRGCRDKIKMSRGDEAKYKNTNKTVSRKTQAKNPSTKNARPKHP